jgi:hypothetical protein
MKGREFHLPREDLLRFAITQDCIAPRLAQVALHLQSGCESCAAWVAHFAQAAAEPVPPSDRVRLPEHWLRPRRIDLAAGLRAGALADTSLVCGAGPYEVDVLVREYEAPRSLEIVGQITKAGHVHEPISDLPVALVDPDETQVVTATATDPLGEFDLAADLSGPYGLRCGTGEEAPCVLVWEGGAA